MLNIKLPHARDDNIWRCFHILPRWWTHHAKQQPTTSPPQPSPNRPAPHSRQNLAKGSHHACSHPWHFHKVGWARSLVASSAETARGLRGGGPWFQLLCLCMCLCPSACVCEFASAAAARGLSSSRRPRRGAPRDASPRARRWASREAGPGPPPRRRRSGRRARLPGPCVSSRLEPSP